MRRATLFDLINGEAVLTAEMALRKKKKAFSVSMDILLSMQARYDAAQARACADQIDVEPYLVA